MATKKPRATITFPPNLYNTLTRFAELQGISLSSMVVGILESAHMPIMRTVALLEAAQDAPREVREGLRDSLEGIAREIEKEAHRDYGQLDFTWGGIGRPNGVSAGGRRRESPNDDNRQGAGGTRKVSKGGKTASNPRPSNTGVRSSKTASRKPSKTTPSPKKNTPRSSGVSKAGGA